MALALRLLLLVLRRCGERFLGPTVNVPPPSIRTLFFFLVVCDGLSFSRDDVTMISGLLL